MKDTRSEYVKGWNDAVNIDRELSQEPCEKLMRLFGTDDVFSIMSKNSYGAIRNKLDNPPLTIGDEVILPTNDDGVVLSYRVDTGATTCLTNDGRVLTFVDTVLHRTGKNYFALAQFIKGFTTKGE